MKKGQLSKSFKRAAVASLLATTALAGFASGADAQVYNSSQSQLNAANCRMNYVDNETNLQRSTYYNQAQIDARDQLYKSQYIACMQQSGAGGYGYGAGNPYQGQGYYTVRPVNPLAAILGIAVERALEGHHHDRDRDRGYRR